LLETLLVEAGYDVRCWANGLAAFEQLVQRPPQLIILDLRLGDDREAGWHILSLLRMEPRTASTPVILLSADRDFLQQRERILRTKKQATPFTKPFDVDELLDKIQQMAGSPVALDLRENQREL
jgi:DNA-binding response OmpR family regulator